MFFLVNKMFQFIHKIRLKQYNYHEYYNILYYLHLHVYNIYVYVKSQVEEINQRNELCSSCSMLYVTDDVRNKHMCQVKKYRK